MLPFEAWISAEDRHNPGNVLIAVAQNGDILGAWIDYAFSLDLVWKGNLDVRCSVGGPYPPIPSAPDAVIMKQVADCIANMEDAAIQGVVNRVPAEYLPRAAADNIVRNLLARRAGVRALAW
jgi:hypothetical protein